MAKNANAPVVDRGAADTSLAGDGPQHNTGSEAAEGASWLLPSGRAPLPGEAAAVERASTIDRAWFKRHPARAYRMRLPVPNEFPDERPPEVGGVRLVLVKQVRPGARLRCRVWVFQRPSDCDTFLADAWDARAPEYFKGIALGMATALLREAGR